MAKIIRRAIPIGAIDEFITPPLLIYMYWNCIRRFSFGATTESESPISRKIPTGHQNFFLRRSFISARHGTAP